MIAYAQFLFRSHFFSDHLRQITTLPNHPRFTCSATSHTPHPLSHALQSAPSEPGVYRFLDDANYPLYIGKARKIRTRLRQYLTPALGTSRGVNPVQDVSPRIRTMLNAAVSIDFIVTKTEAAALALEASLVQECQPQYNVLLKDDRRHPYVLITFSERYPRIMITRTRTKKTQQDRLYGPFVNETALRKLLAVVKATFPLRQRPKKLFSDRPCINFDLGRCPGVCQELVSPEDYRNTIGNVDKLFSGRVEEVLEDLRAEMHRFSSTMNYEQAAIVRDRIANVRNAFVDTIDLKNTFEGAEEAAAIVCQDSFASRDIFALSRNNSICKVVMFRIRGGKVISRFIFSALPNAENSELLGAVLNSHYASLTHPMEIPEEVVLCSSIDDAPLLATILSEKRGKRVNVRGKRGVRVARLVQHNAEMEVQLEQDRARSVTEQLSVLRHLLEPHFVSLVQKHRATRVDRIDTRDYKYQMELDRIECFDISHTSGSNAVGSMAVFMKGYPAPSEYRRYNLPDVVSRKGHPDDFASIRETIIRRFDRFATHSPPSSSELAEFPDLLVIDGGKGQLSSAAEALLQLGLHDIIPVISIAKEEEAIFVEATGPAINYDKDTGRHLMNSGIRLLCRLRDEAHRAAVTAHRKKRGKETLKSGLDSVSGLGPSKRVALLSYFNGSAEAIASALPSALSEAPGIGPTLADRLYHHFNNT